MYIRTGDTINFLATENWPKMKLKFVRILLKIIHLVSGSHIWSFFAQNHMLTKRKSRSIASQITNIASRKSYLVIILPNSYQKLTKSKIRSSWSRFKHRSETEVLCGHYICQLMWKVDQNRNWVKLKSVQTLLRIACLADRKSYVIIICVISVKSLPKEKFCQVKVGSNIAQNRLCSR